MKATTAMLAFLTFGLVVSVATPEAAAQITDAIDTPGNNIVSTQGGACNGAVDDHCTCDAYVWFCGAGNSCTVFVAIICVYG